MPWDLRKSQPYCGYENYDFDVAVRDTCGVYCRYLVRMDEIDQPARIVRLAGPESRTGEQHEGC
jgi:NADH-quinone oxidoreductase subunit D